ncbi:MAG: DUF4339 domain-containing protein [Verrucomicrobiae bacterium]|nr:DUF4339 domain-containing protein [Verrucomicrobiae bacterium]
MTESPHFALKLMISRNFKESGPYSFEQLKEEIHRGAILLDSWVWHEGMDAWLPLQEYLRQHNPAFLDLLHKEKKKTTALPREEIMSHAQHIP